MNAMTLKSLIVLPKYSFKEYCTLKIFRFSVNFNKNSESHEGTFKFCSLSLSLSLRHLTSKKFLEKKETKWRKDFYPIRF